MTEPRTSPPPLRRIAVAGVAGAGKTTLARALAQRLTLPHVELDALYHGPNWTLAPTDVFRQRVREALPADAWVVDGVYPQVTDLVWGQADTLIWLDYPLPFVLLRLLRRVVRRAVTREQLWHGNREQWWHAFSSTNSVFLVAIRMHWRMRPLSTLLATPDYAHLTTLRFRSARQTRRWLAQLPDRSAGDTRGLSS